MFLVSSNGIAQVPQIKNYYPSAGLQLKVLEYNEGANVFVPSLFYKASFLNIRGTMFTFGASAYPTIAVSPSTYKGTVIFGAELPLTLELYLKDIENDYFFFGFGVAAGFYAIREYDNMGGIGAQFVFGGDIPMFRGELGFKGAFTLYFKSSLQGSLGIYYQIGYGH